MGETTSITARIGAQGYRTEIVTGSHTIIAVGQTSGRFGQANFSVNGTQTVTSRASVRLILPRRR